MVVRDKILETSIALFREHWYGKVSIEQITRSVGIAKGYRDKAVRLGTRVVRDIAKGSRNPFQGLLLRLIMKADLINIFRNNVLQNKDGRMKAVYESLVSRGLLKC